MSERITFTADDDTVQILEAVEQRDDIDSTAAAVRECIGEYEAAQQQYAALQQEIDELQQEYEAEIAALETKAERLERANLRILEQREENAELVAYVEDERTAAEKWRQAGIIQKAKWQLFGMEE